jgi:hypothetical protein
MELNIEWLKCPHGREVRSGCPECDKLKNDVLNAVRQVELNPRVPIYRGCNSNGACFCSGRCREIIGYRDRLPFEPNSTTI